MNYCASTMQVSLPIWTPQRATSLPLKQKQLVISEEAPKSGITSEDSSFTGMSACLFSSGGTVHKINILA